MTKALVFSLDDNYVMPFQVFFHSLVQTSSLPEELEIYILHSVSLGLGSIERISGFLGQHGFSLTFLNLDRLIPENLPIRSWDHVSLSTYNRLFIADILPLHIETAFYLDADMLALRSLRPLFDTSVGSLLAAVDHFAPDEGIRLWGAQGGSYFQAGVLVVPVSTWREMRLSKSFLSVIGNQAGRILWWDQDVLNIAIEDRWQRLPIWYNLCQEALRFVPHADALSNGILIHFSGRYKPWNSFNPSLYTAHWDRSYHECFGVPFNRPSLDPSRLRRLRRFFLNLLPSFVDRH